MIPFDLPMPTPSSFALPACASVECRVVFGNTQKSLPFRLPTREGEAGVALLVAAEPKKAVLQRRPT